MWAGVAGALGDVAGGVLNYFGTKETNAQNAADVAATNATNLQIANNANALETEFAQNGISWRVADAAKNGISPLAALGAAEPSASPAVPVMATPQYSSPLNSISASATDLGQNVSRALTATRSPTQQASDALDLAYKAKQNDLLDVQIAGARLAVARQSGSVPGIPSAWTTMYNRDGSTSVVPSPEAAQASHGQFLGPALWSLDNKLIPSLKSGLDYMTPSSAPVDMSYPAQ